MFPSGQGRERRVCQKSSGRARGSNPKLSCRQARQGKGRGLLETSIEFCPHGLSPSLCSVGHTLSMPDGLELHVQLELGVGRYGGMG